MAAELANAARFEDLAEIVLRGAKVLGAQSSALAIFTSDGGPLRLHMTRDSPTRCRATSTTPSRASRSSSTTRSRRSTPPCTAGACCWPTLEEMLARFPATREGSEVLGVRAVAALPLRVEGRMLGSFVAIWAVDHAFSADDVELLEALAAQIALSVSRLRADDERATAVAAMAEANQRLQLLAEPVACSRDRSRSPSRSISSPSSSSRRWATGAGWSSRTSRAGCTTWRAPTATPRRREELERYVRSMVTVMTDAAGARIVTRTGKPLVLPEIDREHVAAALPDPAAQESLELLGAASGAIVPLVAAARPSAHSGCSTGKERGPHTPVEIDTAVEIGRRAGLAVHHARLYGQQRDLADALQRSMLTAPPEPNHCEIVVRYVPAAEGAEIGGDWYDAFLQDGGATVLAIGDVAGHDTRAAAAMGQVRGLLRGIGYSSGGAPAAMLTELDRAVQGLALDMMATALVGRLEQSEEDLRAGRTWFRWSSAGHRRPS